MLRFKRYIAESKLGDAFNTSIDKVAKSAKTSSFWDTVGPVTVGSAGGGIAGMASTALRAKNSLDKLTSKPETKPCQHSAVKPVNDKAGGDYECTSCGNQGSFNSLKYDGPWQQNPPKPPKNFLDQVLDYERTPEIMAGRMAGRRSGPSIEQPRDVSDPMPESGKKKKK
jgi:hypothetical protein